MVWKPIVSTEMGSSRKELRFDLIIHVVLTRLLEMIENLVAIKLKKVTFRLLVIKVKVLSMN